MSSQSTTPLAESPALRIDDIFKLTLVDGLKATIGGREIRYQVVTLRETSVADERRAEREAERAVQVNGSWKLLVSESTFKHVLNMLHIESLRCDDQVLSGALIDQDIYDRLREGGGTREDAASTLDNIITSGVVEVKPAQDMLPGLMRSASASGATAKDLSSIAIRASQTMGIPLNEVMDVLDEANAAGKAGGFELRDMAKSLPAAMAGAKQSGLTGREGFRKIIAMLQASVITAGTKDEAANNVFNWLGKINSDDTAKDFKKQGIDLRGRLVSGRAAGVDSADTFVTLVDEIATKDQQYTLLKAQLAKAKTEGEKFQTLDSMADILQGKAIGTVVQDRQALMSLVSVMNNREYVASIQDKMRSGKGSLAKDFEVISAESSFKATTAANNKDIAMSTAFGEGGPLKKLLDGANWAAEKFPMLTATVVGATAALGVFTTALLAFGVLGGKSVGGLPGRGGPGGGPPRTGGTPGASPKVSASRGPFGSLGNGATGEVPAAKVGGVGKTASMLGKLGWIGAGASLAYELFGTSQADLDILNAADARKANATRPMNWPGNGFNDPQLLMAAGQPGLDVPNAPDAGKANAARPTNWRGNGFNDPRLLTATSQSEPGTDARKLNAIRPDNWRGNGFNDPRLLTITSPGTAEQTLSAGRPTKIELGEGRLGIDVRVTDERATATARVDVPMQAVKINAGATKPEGAW